MAGTAIHKPVPADSLPGRPGCPADADTVTLAPLSDPSGSAFPLSGISRTGIPAAVSPAGLGVPVSATLAANEVLGHKRAAGEPVLPLAFGEAGLPAHPLLREALGAGADGNSYGPVAGQPALREAAAGYWSRRGLPTTADAVVSGPGSKSLLFGLLLAIGADVALPRP